MKVKKVQYSKVPSDTTFMLPENQSRIKGLVVSERVKKNSRKNTSIFVVTV